MTSGTPSADKIFEVGSGQIGYHEGANNYNKFAAAVGVPNNDAWCTTFASWEFLTAGFKSLVLMSDYSVDQLNWFQARGRASVYPAVGALCWLGPGGGDHTAWVYAYDADNIYTIEGNWNNQVLYMKRPRRVAGPGGIEPYMYGLPNFAEGVITADPAHPVAGSRYQAVASVTTSAKVPGIVSTPPVTTPPVVTPPVTTRKSYTTTAGQTYASVASLNGVALADLLAWNNIVPPTGSKLWTGPVPVETPPPVTSRPWVWADVGNTQASEPASVKLVRDSLNREFGTSVTSTTWDDAMKALYARWQVSQGFSGADADGKPGSVTLTALGAKYGFDIRGAFPSSTPPVTSPPATPGAWVTSVAINDKTGVSYARYTGSLTTAQAIEAACRARGVTSASGIANWTRGYQTAISRESSGDANACNTNDLNNITPSGYSKVADYGTGYGNPSGNLNGKLVNYQCSRGIAQCIPQTFAKYHCPGTSNMIYDPVANIAASMGYVGDVYGVADDGSNLASKVQQFDPSRPAKGY